MKISASPPEKVFRPYSIVVEVQTQDDHDAISYAGMCSTCIPDAIRKKAMNSVTSKFKDNADSYARRYQSLLREFRRITRDQA